MFIPDPDLDILPIPDPGVKKAPDPGSGSATLMMKEEKNSEKGVGVRSWGRKEGFNLASYRNKILPYRKRVQCLRRLRLEELTGSLTVYFNCL
jgi:hypothetical protein